MKHVNTIRYEKVQYDINREAIKISALSSSEIDNMNILHAKKYYPSVKLKL